MRMKCAARSRADRQKGCPAGVHPRKTRTRPPSTGKGRHLKIKNPTLFSAIASYGENFRERYLNQFDPGLLSNNSWKALDFFLSRACFQGRLDTISERVYKAVKKVLEPEFSDTDFEASHEKHRQKEWAFIGEELGKRIGKGKVGKARDVEMVLRTLKFIGNVPRMNIVSYSVDRINNGKIGNHYAELQPSKSGKCKGITQVGPKIAALYLRDLVSLYKLENKVPDEFAFCLQAVDTWVRKLAYKLEIVEDKANDQEIQKAIIDLCRKQNISSLHFNQGAWYVGMHSFEIVLDMLGNRQSLQTTET